MKSTMRVLSGLLALVLVGLGLVWVAPHEGRPAPAAGRAVGGGAVLDDDPNVLTAAEMQVVVGPLVTPTLTPALRDLPPYVPGPPELDREMAQKESFGFLGNVQGPLWHDPLVDLQRGVQSPAPDAFAAPLTNWAGLDYNVFPPDTTGDVGPNHFVQAVNSSGSSVIRVFRKSDGAVLADVAMQSLAPVGSPCATGYCDPTVIYDRLADRWFINEFADSSRYEYCLYVSTSPDPTGTWYYYTWDLVGYDYPKYGLWPDAYYMGYNGGPSGYRQVFAFDRAKMLLGQPATYQVFDIPVLTGLGFQLLMPASLEGATVPPAGAGGIFARPNDTETNGPAGYPTVDFMEMWEFHVDWVTPANSTLTRLPDVPMAEYDCTLCGTGSDWSCMPQPGTTQAIDPIREPLHYQLQYRNWGSYQTLVGGFVEDVDGDDKAAVRWFEMRKTAGAWSMYQQGTVGGWDAQHRSVTSVALDGAGGMAMGYTRTGPEAPYYPSIMYAGRRPWDPLNTMTWVDVLAQAGSGSQESYDRWGDYSGIGVDPVDDCTFWYTTEYMGGTSSATRVISFRFDADFNVDAAPNTIAMCGGGTAVYTVDLAKTCALAGTVTMSASGLPVGATASWSAGQVSPPGSTTLTIENIPDATNTYSIDVIGTNAGAGTRLETVVLNVASAAPGVATLPTPADGSTGVALAPSLTWGAVSGAASYDVQVATDPDFGTVVRSATGLTSASYTPSPDLSLGTVYYWRVRAINACGLGGYSDGWAFRTVPTQCTTYGPGTTGPIDDAKGANAQTTIFNLSVPAVTVTDLDVVDLAGTHTYISDLSFVLQSPGGTQVALIPRMCADADNFDKDLDDEAASALACPLNDGAVQRPSGALSNLNGAHNAGTWTLRVTDSAKNNTGSVLGWSLRMCSGNATEADYGDLAVSYGIAWHAGEGTLRLGAAWSADDTFSPPPREDDSDDGVSFPFGFQTGPNNTIRVNVQGLAANGRWVRIWFDWDDDKVFDDAELVYDGAVALGDNDLAIVGPGVSQPVNYRVRLYDSAGAPPLGLEARDADSYGGASSGEVEDGTAPAPTAVKLVSFAAAPAAQGILVTWETASEDDNAGFNLYRSDSPAVLGQLLNGALIPSQAPGGGQGAAYVYPDGTAAPGATYYYTLEAVDLYDGRTRYGPAVTGLWRAYLPAVPR